MADYQSVFAVGDALAKYLTNNYDSTVVGFPCNFKLVSSAEIANEDATALDKTVSLYLHRMTTSEHYRYVTRLQDAPSSLAHVGTTRQTNLLATKREMGNL